MSFELVVVLSIAVMLSLVAGYLAARIRSESIRARLAAELNTKTAVLNQCEMQLSEARDSNQQFALELHAVQLECRSSQKDLEGVRENLAQSLRMVGVCNEKIDLLTKDQFTRGQELSAAQTQVANLRGESQQQEARFEGLRTEMKEQAAAKAAVDEQKSMLAEELASLKSNINARETHFQEQMEQFKESKEALKQEFENLANKIFEAKGKTFSEQSRQSLDAMLNPFRQQISEFKDDVGKVHVESTKQQTQMRSELQQLQSMHQKMSKEAHDLATALKGQKKMQGNWGEMVLENVLDRSGLRLGHDYKREVSFTTDEGARSRPDVVVYLPQEKHLVIDAKVSLNAYTRYVNAEDDLERKQALAEHVQAISARIKELSNRDYFKLAGINSPEMVFMFVPIESAFVDALKADEALFQKAIELNVLVATPTTLLTSLNIVRQLWRFEDQNKHTAELAKKAESVFKKLKTFLGSFEGVKKGLDNAQASYLLAESQLVNGKGNLVKQVGEFKLLAPAIKDQLPDYYSEKAALELTPANLELNERTEAASDLACP